MTEEKSLTLVVQEKTLGKLITNAEQIREFVKQKLETYSVDNYQGDEKQAAKDKAELNNAAKLLNDERIKLEKEFMSPFNDFKDIVSDTVNLIKQASSKFDVIVKEKERIEKEAKKAEVQKIWDSKNFSLVTLDRIFNPKWLNKTCKISAVESDIGDIITRIQNDLNALVSFGEDTAPLQELYLSNLNLQATLNKGAELKANRERLASQKAEEEKRREEAKAAEAQRSAEENGKTEKAAEAQPLPEPQKPKTEKSEPVYLFNLVCNQASLKNIESIIALCGMERTHSVTLKATRTQIEHFKALLARDGIVYEKINAPTIEVK